MRQHVVTGRRGRRLAGTGVAAAIVVATAVGLPMTASAATPAAGTGGFAPADEAAITPGVEIVIDLADGPANCTTNFLYTAAGSPGDHPAPGHPAPEHPEPGYPPAQYPAPEHPAPEHPAPHPPGNGAVFLGTAAHCVSEGGSMTSLDGCDPANMPLPLGTPVTVLGNDGEEYTATLAYSSWLTMQQAGETDPARCQLNDLALLELDPADVARANPSVPEFGGPVGLDEDGTEFGDRVFTFQPNQVGNGPKQGISLGQPDGEQSHRVITVPPGVPGDSGSGYLSESGAAFGVLSSLIVEPGQPPANGVADLAQALDYANTVGGLGVGLVDGTEPFDPDVPMGPLPAMPLDPTALLAPVLG